MSFKGAKWGATPLALHGMAAMRPPFESPRSDPQWATMAVLGFALIKNYKIDPDSLVLLKKENVLPAWLEGSRNDPMRPLGRCQISFFVSRHLDVVMWARNGHEDGLSCLTLSRGK